jgi:hypothetical protein
LLRLSLLLLSSSSRSCGSSARSLTRISFVISTAKPRHDLYSTLSREVGT